MIYVASRVHHAPMWRDLRQSWPINSTWIDEAGEGETADLGELWARIEAEICQADAVVMYVCQKDFPLKGALIEAGMALAIGKPVIVVADGVELEPRSMRPLGSWVHHPLVRLVMDGSLETVLHDAANAKPCGQACIM